MLVKCFIPKKTAFSIKKNFTGKKWFFSSKNLFFGNKTLDQRLGVNLKDLFFAQFYIKCATFCIFQQKQRK